MENNSRDRKQIEQAARRENMTNAYKVKGLFVCLFVYASCKVAVCNQAWRNAWREDNEVNNELGSIRKEVIMAEFKVIARYLLGDTKQGHSNRQIA
jgi:hypothetical protein